MLTSLLLSKSKNIIFTAFLFLCFNALSQNQQFIFKSLIKDNEIDVKKRIKSEAFIDANESTYSILYYDKNNSLFVKTRNLEDDSELMKYEILYTKDKDLRERKIVNFSIKGNKMAISTWSGIIIFKKNKKYFKKDLLIPTNVMPLQIMLTDSFLYCCHYYFSHPNQETRVCFINKFDLQGKLLKTIEIQIPYPEYTTYAPFSPFSFSKNSIVVVIQTPYIFYEVNFNLQIINKLNHYSPDWVDPPDSFRRVFHNDFFNYKLLDSFSYRKISRLECSNFIDDTTLFIKRRERIIDNYNFLNYYYDIFKKNDAGSWDFVRTNKEDITPLQMDRKTDSTFCFIFSSNSYHLFNKNHLIKLELAAPISPIGLTIKEWIIEKEKWLKSNDPIPIILKYRLNENY
ncbi:MAG: hypothetical protein IT243_03440 [Bacteroidia bacterium]|nr:hypothetical protein [Bacteroidia bacterium]